MYNARLFYNVVTGEIYRCQTITSGGALSIKEDVAITSTLFEIPIEEIGFLEWTDPGNELEAIRAAEKFIRVDITTTPHTVYGVEPEIIEPTDEDEISGSEFLSMVEGVL